MITISAEMKLLDYLSEFTYLYPDFVITLDVNPPDVIMTVQNRKDEFISFIAGKGIAFSVAGGRIVHERITYG